MFQRVLFEDWVHNLPIFSFIVFFVVFLWVTIRALRLNTAECDRLSSLPLDAPTETIKLP